MRVSAGTLSAAPGRRALFRGGAIAFVTGVLLLAGAVHICTILLIPTVAESDGWSRLASFAAGEEFAEISTGRATQRNVAGLDPLFVNAACRLQLADAPVEIVVPASERLWSLALYDPQGTIIFSLNDRTAVEGQLDMIVATPSQNAALKQSPPPGLDRKIVVQGVSDDLIALLRLFAPNDKARLEARELLADTECLPLALGDSGG
jgi:uncharacterized membrane protein